MFVLKSNGGRPVIYGVLRLKNLMQRERYLKAVLDKTVAEMGLRVETFTGTSDPARIQLRYESTHADSCLQFET